MREPSFWEELRLERASYAGRPTPLYLAARVSEDLGLRVYLKREDLAHTGAHKINNAIGQALPKKRKFGRGCRLSGVKRKSISGRHMSFSSQERSCPRVVQVSEESHVGHATTRITSKPTIDAASIERMSSVIPSHTDHADSPRREYFLPVILIRLLLFLKACRLPTVRPSVAHEWKEMRRRT